MIKIEEVGLSDTGEFWEKHIKYLTDDGIISDSEDIEYFSGEEYRGIIEEHMAIETDRHHLIYFTRENDRIGAASFCIYGSEDGQCFILDFWVFEKFRGNGTGHACFEALEKYAESLGAKYYMLNSTKEGSVRFWKTLGFVPDGVDEYDMPLFVKK